MNLVISMTIGVALFLVFAQTFATERFDNSSSATGGASTANATAPSSIDQRSRAFGLGTAASANNATCLTPWLAGLFVYTDVGCARDRDIKMLHGLGMSDAALQRACLDPEMYQAIRASGDNSKCKTAPATVMGQ